MKGRPVCNIFYHKETLPAQVFSSLFANKFCVLKKIAFTASEVLGTPSVDISIYTIYVAVAYKVVVECVSKCKEMDVNKQHLRLRFQIGKQRPLKLRK